ncbi:MAG: OmpA family protein [Deltaproteobacteria bacterium]|nr:OmpA family protein [Deltaproteobacteria bacterium]
MTLALKKAPTTLEVNVLYKKNKELIPGAAILVKDKATGKITAYKADTGQWKGKYEPGDYTFSGFIAGFEKVDLDATVVKEKHNVVNIELRKIIIKIGRVQFPYDSDVIKTESYPVLEDVLKKIQQQDEEGGFEKILVEGHTSSEGSDEYNLTLSQKRAEAVKKWLAQHGIPAEKIEPIGYGESRLLKPDEGDEAAMEDNRRVEFIFEEKVVEGAKAPEGSPPPEEETAE